MPLIEGEKRPTAFVSYAQSSRSWQKTVLDFTSALRDPGGVDAELDLFHGADHQRWADFGSNLIEESDFTLVAVDAAYKRRWLGQEKEGIGAGAAREAATIKAIFEENQKDFVRRVKIVLLPGKDEDDIPDVLRGHCEWFKVDSFDEAGLEPLLRSLWGRPAFPKPPLAPIPALPPKAYANLESEGDDENGPGKRASSRPAHISDSAHSGPSASDEAKLRGRLSSVQTRLKRVRSRPVRSESQRETADLEQEETALEVSLEALASTQTTGGRRRKALRTRLDAPRDGSEARTIRLRRIAVALAAVAGLVALSFLLGTLTESSGDPSPSVSVTADGLAVKGPPGWTRTDGDARIGGLELSDPINLTGSADEGQAVAGISTAVGPTLLPAAYRSQINRETRRTAVGLGSLQAYRYDGLQAPGGDDPVSVYVAPTSLGVATLACRVPEGPEHSAASRRCAQIAATMRLAKGNAYRLGPSAGLARVLRRRLGQLKESRRSAMQEFNRATDAAGQSAAAKSLANAFDNAATGVAAVPISPESALARGAVLAGLRSARSAYNSLATGARKEDRNRYEVAASAAEWTESAIARRLKKMKKLGYKVGGQQLG